MTQEEKQLLLKDLCTRLPYGVVIHTYYNKPMDIKCTGCDLFANTVNLDIPNDDEAKVYVQNIRSYLRPMSSMTEEERDNLQSLHDIISNENYGDGYSPAAWEAISEWVDYCNSRHLDYHGLISMGLAFEATDGMYKTE